MSKIETFPFNKDNFDQIKDYKFGRNWPVVYVIEDKKEVYIGQTVNAYFRSKQHVENPERKKLKEIHIITDEEFNVSAALDIESWLIQYISADGKFILQNGNGGLKNHNYYDRQKYKTKFEIAWDRLREKGIVQNTLADLKNSDLFKYSPYKSLTEDQFLVAKQIYKDIKKNEINTFIVNGKPGTGKTILATYLFKYLKEQEETKNLNIGLVVPMASLRKTIRNVFSKIKGLKSNMVIGPNDVVKQQYDLLIVDESHRLQRRKGIMGYGAYDTVNKGLGLDNEGTQLDWIMKSSKHQVFFYDENQSIKPADIRAEDFRKLNAKKYTLNSQMRVEAGEEYIKFIEDIFDLQKPKHTAFSNYDFQIFDEAQEMVDKIKEKDKKHKLARVVAGYAWPWHTKPGSSSKQKYDIGINGLELIWNSTAQDWVNSSNAINEVGCIHTVQGYDLNYVGVIIGPELSYDIKNKKLVVDKQKYFDTNGRNGISDPSELERYIINIYKTLLTRGIMGTYMYICDESLRNYFNDVISQKPVIEEKVKEEKTEKIKSPYTKMVSLPLYESVGCGELMFADSTVQEMVDVPEEFVSKGSKYFVLRTDGDSMDKAGIHDGDLVLCRKDYHPEIGNKVIALIGDDATIKEYRRDPEGNVILRPCSTNPKHKDRIFTEYDDLKVQGVVVRVLE
ncbi:MAG: DNA/RNA helicase domain-containing protein [bacterium]